MSSTAAAVFGAATALALASLYLKRKHQPRVDGGAPGGQKQQQKQKFSTILFDMDGILANVAESYRIAIVQTAAHFGVSIEFEDISKAKAAGNANNDWKLSQRLIAERWDAAARGGEEAPEYEAVKDVFEEIYQGGLWKTEALIIDSSVLQRLQDAGVAMAVVTGRPRDPDCVRFLRHYGIEKFFTSVVTMHDAPPKPSPEPLLMALRELGVEPGQHVAMIGDTVDDIHAALAAGCVGMGVVAPQFWGSAETVAKEEATLLAAGAADILPPSLEALLPLCAAE